MKDSGLGAEYVRTAQLRKDSWTIPIQSVNGSSGLGESTWSPARSHGALYTIPRGDVSMGSAGLGFVVSYRPAT